VACRVGTVWGTWGREVRIGVIIGVGMVGMGAEKGEGTGVMEVGDSVGVEGVCL
jgi:hypothetical protein